MGSINAVEADQELQEGADEVKYMNHPIRSHVLERDTCQPGFSRTKTTPRP